MTSLRTKPETGTAHTPGQWSLDNNDVRDEAQSILSDATGCVVAEAYTLDRPGECEANARLIAAAPDMFEALRDVVTFASLYNGKMEDTLGDEALAALGETALAVLTRAEGHQP